MSFLNLRLPVSFALWELIDVRLMENSKVLADKKSDSICGLAGMLEIPNT